MGPGFDRNTVRDSANAFCLDLVDCYSGSGIRQKLGTGRGKENGIRGEVRDA